MKISGALLLSYESDPLGNDDSVRHACAIPANRYYAVTLYPEDRRGEVRLTEVREVKARKISKSP